MIKKHERKRNIKTIITHDYELIILESPKRLLILFPAYPCNALHTQSEFNIVDIALKYGVALLLMNFNLHLYSTEKESGKFAFILAAIVDVNQLN